MVYFKRLRSSGFVSLEAFKMYYVMRTFAPSLHRKSTDFLIICECDIAAMRAYIRQERMHNARDLMLDGLLAAFLHINW